MQQNELKDAIFQATMDLTLLRLINPNGLVLEAVAMRAFIKTSGNEADFMEWRTEANMIVREIMKKEKGAG